LVLIRSFNCPSVLLISFARRFSSDTEAMLDLEGDPFPVTVPASAASMLLLLLL
jgi:hypothetical protein